MKTEFFLEMDPPTATAQMKQVNFKTRRFYDPPEVKAMKIKFRTALRNYVPKVKYTGPVALYCGWYFRTKGNHRHNTWKTSKPDTDNLQKALKDIMTDLGFWTDDALVVSERVEKRWSDTPGVYICIREK